MKYFFLWLCFSLFFISCSSDNKLTSKEKSEGWVLLFNGKDFAGWRQCNGESMPSNWIIEDGAMKVLTGEGKKVGQGSKGDIIFKDKKWKAAKELYNLKLEIPSYVT